MKKKIALRFSLLVLITIIICLMSIIGPIIAAELFHKDLPFEVEIIEGDKVATYYGEPNYDIPLIGVQIAIMKRGTYHLKHLRLTNTGVEPLSLILVAGELDDENNFTEGINWGYVTIYPEDTGTLSAGQSANFTVNVYAFLNAELGWHYFVIRATEVP